MHVARSPSRSRANVASCLVVFAAFAAFGGRAQAAPRRGASGAPEVDCEASNAAAALPEAEASADELYRRGLCAEAGRHYIAASKLYQTALARSPRSSLAERLHLRSRYVARKMASVRLEPGAVPEGATVTIASTRYELGTQRFVDPGTVKVEVTAPGYVDRSVTYELGDGEHRVLTIVLTPVGRPLAGTPGATAPSSSTPASTREPSSALTPEPRSSPARLAAPTAPAAPSSSSGGWRTLGVVALGVGGAGLTAGAITGALALSHANEVRDECPTKATCSARGAAAARSGATESTISTIATIGGTAVALAGLGLVIWGETKATVRPSVGAMNGLVLSAEL